MRWMSWRCGSVVAVMAGAAGAQPMYEIVDLTDLLDPLGLPIATAASINNDGTIVGFAPAEDFYEAAVVWHGAEDVEMLGLLPGDNAGAALRVEGDGTILGVSNFVEVVQCPNFIKIYETRKAVAWTDGAPSNLNELVSGGAGYIDLTVTQDRTDGGAFVGWGRSFGKPPYTSYGFLMDADGVVTDLGSLTRPMAANESGQVVGYDGTGQDKAYLWDDGVLTNLHEGQGFSGVTSRAWAISDDGVILGEAQFDIAKPEEPTAWIGGVAQRLVPEVSRPQGVATGVNGAGVVVGYYNDLDDLGTEWMSFRIDDGVRTDLFDLLVDVDGWTSLLARGINDKGQIVGYGVHNNQLGRAFLMTPVCAADFNGDGALDILDFVALQAAFQAGDGSADINGDGHLDILDFVAFQGLFQGGCA